jgi:3-phenylpropionate/trans-cinnamate dioxygenase ferredoxin component
MNGDGYSTLCKAEELGDDDVRPYYLRDRRLRLNVARVDGRLYAFDGLCTHQQCPLSAGLLEGTVIMCQCHGSKFDLRTGAVLRGPADEGLTTFEACEHQGEIRVKV